MSINYKELKHLILKSCTQCKPNNIEFIVNYDKLNKLISPFNLTMVNMGTKSRNVTVNDVPLLAEYFEKQRLSWFNEHKEFTILVLVETGGEVPEELWTLLEKMNTLQVDDPGLDKVETLTNITANYPCYFALVASYESNDPKRMGKPSYEIVIRANKVVIKSDLYKYNSKDMS